MLFYSLAFGTLLLESIFKLGFTEIMMILKPQIIFPMTIGSSVFIPEGSIQEFFNNLLFNIINTFFCIFLDCERNHAKRIFK